MVGQMGPPVLLCFGDLTRVETQFGSLDFLTVLSFLKEWKKIRLTSLIHAPKYVNALSGCKTP